MTNRTEQYTLYFESLIDELWEQHKFPNTRLVDGRHFHQFSSGHRIGSYYVVGFHKQGARDPRDRQAFTMLGLWSDSRETNKSVFDALEEEKRKSKIEKRFGQELEWYRRDEWMRGDELKRSAIGLWCEGYIDGDAHTLEKIKRWHIENLLKLKEVFPPFLVEAKKECRRSRRC